MKRDLFALRPAIFRDRGLKWTVPGLAGWRLQMRCSVAMYWSVIDHIKTNSNSR